KAAGGLFALDATLRAENLSLHAVGEGDLGKRVAGPKGVAVDARTPALARLVGGPKSGAARVTGVLSGDQTAWRFAGAASVADVAPGGGYALARVSGPFEASLAKGVLGVKAKIAGAGGRGQGFVAAVLGGAPVASLDGQRLANGQLMLRRIDLTGHGLKLKASGGRSLLGALTFKGEAQVSN